MPDKERKKTVFRITNSWTIKDAFRWVRKNKWFGEKPVTEHNFYAIVREVGKALAERYITTGHLSFPMGMGEIYLSKKRLKTAIVNGRLVGGRLDKVATFKLWNEDPEAKKNKVIVRFEGDYYRTKYRKLSATYRNKIMYRFSIHKELQKRLSKNITDGLVDAYCKPDIYVGRYKHD